MQLWEGGIPPWTSSPFAGNLTCAPDVLTRSVRFIASLASMWWSAAQLAAKFGSQSSRGPLPAPLKVFPALPMRGPFDSHAP